MKKYVGEIVVILLQMFVFYLLPMCMGNIGALGMVFLILLTTFILSIVIGAISKNKIKYLYPIAVAILFIPSIFIYYNESAFVHSLWYLVVSSIGLAIGIVIHKLLNIKLDKVINLKREKIKRNIFIVVLIILIALWFSGIIPKQIGKIYGINYMKNNFPEMELEYVNIEWSKHYGDYIISFEDKDNQNYSCVIGPKYLPISIGQGIFAIEETYKEKYNSNYTLPYTPDGMQIADGNEIKIPATEKEYNRDAKNVTIEVLKDTITNKSVEILITDNNEDYFGWGVDFKVQKNVNGEWKDLKYISDDLTWIEIAYVPNKDNQMKQKLDIEKYYGILENGTYRVVKSVYDKGYIEIYSNEFEIK